MRRYGRSPHNSMVHCNGNLLCSIDVETTGFDCKENDIWQIAIIPLDSQIKPLKSILPFFIPKIQPERPKNVTRKALRKCDVTLPELMLEGLDRWVVVDLFENWFQKLELPENSRIMPLGQNYVFDRAFLIEWLGGPLNYDRFFHYHIRDTMTTALFLNDRYDAHSEKVPFPKIDLTYLANITGAHNEKPHNAMYDAFVTAEIYRRMTIFKAM